MVESIVGSNNCGGMKKIRLNKATAPANSYVGEQDWCMYTCPDCSYADLDSNWELFQREIEG